MSEPSKLGPRKSDASGMDEFGYAQTLDRSIGKFASFAAGVSYISILTGVSVPIFQCPRALKPGKGACIILEHLFINKS